MIDKDLEAIRAEGQLAVGDPEAYVLSNPTPRDWTLTAQEIAQSVKLDPRKMTMLRKTDFEPETLNIAETLGQGVWDFITDGSMLSSIQTSLASWSSPDMTQEEADRLMQDVLYTRSYTRKAKDILNAQKITHEDWYDFANGVGSFIKYALLGGVTGSPAAIGMFAGAEAGSQLEADLVDRYIEKTGDIKGYTARERNIDLGLSGAYGVFNGAVESMLGVERVATGAVRSRINKELTSRLIGASRSTGKSAREIMMRLEDLQVQMGRKFSQKAWQNARRILTSAGEEGLEEAIQSLGEDLTTAIAGYSDDFTASGVLGKAATNAMYGAIIGGPAGWGLYRYNRKTFIDRLNKWNKDKNVGLKDNEVVEFADKILDEGKSRMFDEIATRAEIKSHYGQAYDLVKKRISDVIDATGTTPWTDKTKTKEEYVQVLADSITWPSISVANQLNIPLSEFLEIADIESWVVGNTVGFKPITSIEDIDEIIRQQKLIIKEQRANKKLGVDNEDALNTAKQRLAIAERVRLELIQEQNIIQERTTRRKEKADYTTAKGLQPDHVKTLDNATQATADQDFVLFAGKRIPVEYQVVELDSVQPSHINGTPNPNYTNKALQNRASRGTTQDVADLRGKASPENFTPERLMKATTSAEGSPVVNAKNEVIAGNGRTEIVRYAYENPQTAEQYKQELQKQGFNIDGMNKPMLVRKNTTLNDQEQVAAADISNISETSAFDEASQARRDTQYLKDSPTAIDFASKLPMSEKRGLMLNNGKWNKRKVQQRYEDALLAWLCGNDTTLFENLVLDRKLSQKVIDTLTANGALLYETATKYPELELREDIYHALVKMQNATRDNFIELTQQLELDGHDVMPENIMVWNWLFTDASTNRQFMNSYATILANNHESVEAGQDMFGQKVAPLSKKDALIQALKKADQAKAETAMARGREYEPLFNEENVATDVNLAAAIISYNNQFAPTNNLNQTLAAQGEDFLFQKRGIVRGFYDPELLTITLTKYWNETTFVHEQHHRFLDKLFGYYKQIQTGERVAPDAFIQSMDQLFQMLDIDQAQDQLSVVQQEKFATMVEAYLTGLGVDNPDNLAFKTFLHWIPEQYKSILDLGYLDENNEIQNPILDQQSITWFNKWFANPFAPSLATSPEAQKLVNPTDENGEIVPSKQKVMNDREKDWGQDSEQQQKADAQLWRAMGENTPTNIRAALDGEKERMKAEANNQPDDTKLPEEHKPTIREKWFRPRQKDAREIAATKAREYLAQNPEHARQLAFADPETMTEFDAPVDQGMLIRAVMETVPHGSDEWYILNDNLATVKSMSGSTLSLSGDQSHQAYLDAKREVEAARELKAAINYAGTRRGAIDKWNGDIRAFIAKNTTTILATEPNSEERKTAIKAFLEEAKTKFSANTTNAILNQMDLTGLQTKNSQAFIKWAEKQIKQATHAKIDTAEQKELMKASIAAQLALKEIDSTIQKDGLFVRATQAAKDIRHWQFVKDKIKKAYIGRWGKFGIFWDNLFGSYAPSAMLMSVNTLFFANVPSTALNSRTIKMAATIIGKNNVDKAVTDAEEERIRQVFNASGVNLAQMDKPTSPSTLHGEKYMNTEQKHWYNFTFEILGRTDNVFRIPRFVDALARIATKNAGGDTAKATTLFKEYAKLNNQSDEAKIARKQALAVANMAVFTQDGMMASALNHIRSALNTITRAPLGLDPQGFGLGNILAPFLKTGANITEMGLSATFAPIKTIAMGFQKLQGKEIPDIKKMTLVSDWINLAYTCVAVAVLASISGDDEDWYEEPYQSGRKYDPNKPYDSIRFGNTWVKLDIFGPMAIPLRTAAMLVKDWETDKLQAISDGMFEALSDTPLVQSFTDSNLDYMTRQPEKYWSSFAYNQANKLVPAQVKSATRAVSRGTGATWNTDWLGQTINRKFHRNYGLDSTRLTTNDLINVLTNRIKVGND